MDLGVTRDTPPPPPPGPKFLHFHAVLGKNFSNSVLAPPGLVSPSTKSWIRHWIPLLLLSVLPFPKHSCSNMSVIILVLLVSLVFMKFYMTIIFSLELVTQLSVINVHNLVKLQPKWVPPLCGTAVWKIIAKNEKKKNLIIWNYFISKLKNSINKTCKFINCSL